jgi:hypothetical protein
MKIAQCPECYSTNIKYFDARKIFNCLDCGFSFSEQEFNKLRIFLSYGHDHNEELVHLIKTDHKRAGQDVWFDKSGIKFGDVQLHIKYITKKVISKKLSVT